MEGEGGNWELGMGNGEYSPSISKAPFPHLPPTIPHPPFPIPCKLNLYLDILRRRDAGFHELRTLFLQADLCDGLRVEVAGERAPGDPVFSEFIVEGPFSAGVPGDSRNLAWRAAEEVAALAGRAVPALRARLLKRVPNGAGLGGGSANAAAMLRAASAAWGLGLSDGALLAVASKLGSDCAFFLRGGAAEATGRGEVLEPIATRRIPLLIVVPHFSVGTREAYGRLTPAMLGERSDAAAARRWIAWAGEPVPRLANSFEAALEGLHPELGRTRGELTRLGAVVARLSGSGSASFGLFASEADRDAAAERLDTAAYRLIHRGWAG